MSHVSHLECSVCSRRHEAGKVQTLCECGGPLLVRYDLVKVKATWSRDSFAKAPPNMWRYAPLLPVEDAKHIVTLGEGLTPIMKADHLAARIGASDLWVKDEGLNPTGSFKARGMASTVSMCVELGLSKIAVASAGNAGSALAAYAAACGIEAHIFVPRDVPRSNYIECRAYGAHVNLIDGLISDCGRIIAERKQAEGWFDISGLKEPYRIEGKKTMGFEIAEQFGWTLPGAILYPTGGGVGLIGMWKAFDELEALGWISSHRPKMIAVQTTGCQPVVRAFERGESKTAYLGKRPYGRRRATRSQASGRRANARGHPRQFRHGHRRERRGTVGREPGTRRRHRHLRRARRRCLPGRAQETSRRWNPEARRAHRSLQYRHRIEIPGSIFHAISGQ